MYLGDKSIFFRLDLPDDIILWNNVKVYPNLSRIYNIESCYCVQDRGQVDFVIAIDLLCEL